MKIHFANTAEQTECIAFANELQIESDGWAQLAPLGDYPGRAVMVNADRSVTAFEAIQRLDRASADTMVRNFYSLGNRIKRFIKGCSIYNGHPDAADAGDKYPDKHEKGLIVELQVRDGGLYCKPAFNNDGEAMLSQNQKLFLSGRWSSDELPEENGRRIFRPDKLKSAGLTTRPNLPVQHLNEKQPPPDTMKSLIIQMLAALGISFANDAEDSKVVDALRQIGEKAKTADALTTEKATLANECQTLKTTVTARDNTITQLMSERDTLRTNFANERKSRITGLLDGAITAGRITAADRAGWETKLAVEANFANEATALEALKPALNTQSKTLDLGNRKVSIANASDRRDALQTLVKTEMETGKCDYDIAFARVQKNNPALFEAMKPAAA